MDSIKKRNNARNPFEDGGSGAKRNGYESAIQQSLEDESNVYIDVLSENVRAMKQIASNMKDHLSNEKSMFDDLGKGFDKSNKLLAFTNAKMDELMRSKSGRVTCYLILFVIAFFVILYFLG